mmetsp:Transcript_2270/g.6785  ORF Transcript_2270/g.6785 Transcript_2270/m.6785 type:complete len:274 (+) Transcript_2270:84-905(+)
MSSWRRVTSRLRFSLPPAEMHTAKAYAEKTVLLPMMMRYSPCARGVVVAYSNLEFAENNAKIDGVSPYLHMTATADLLAFCPPKGTLLVGKVTHVSKGFIGLKILQSFYCVIARKHAPAGFVQAGEGCWERRSVSEQDSLAVEFPSGSVIKPGVWLRFTCLGMMSTKSGLYQLRGSLTDEDCLYLGELSEQESTAPPQDEAKSLFLGGDVQTEDQEDPLMAIDDVLGDPLASLRVDKSAKVESSEAGKKTKRKRKHEADHVRAEHKRTRVDPR